MSEFQCRTISVVLPTLNAQRVLDKCLTSIAKQNYPQNKLEIIIADGGSTDATLKIARKFGAKIYKNPLKTGESGKAVALYYAKGELVALIDSDNVLPDKNWLKHMTTPFSDPQILGSESWEFTYRKSDNFINRYCALLGMGDPFCLFVGNYDKKSLITGKWTSLDMEQEDKGRYLKIKIGSGILPTIGANGTIWRREILKKAVGKSDYLFDTDIPYLIAKKSYYFAKVKVGIIHLYCEGLTDFYRKQKRRAKDFFYLEEKRKRLSTFQRYPEKQFYFIISTVTFFPLLLQALNGFFKEPDLAWFFHPLACIITLWIYGTETILSLFKKAQMDRREWKQ